MSPQFSIGSYSFHRLLRAGKHDMFKYIEDSKRLGMTQLDPWIGHLEPVTTEDKHLREIGDTQTTVFSDELLAYLHKVKAAVHESGLPIGCLAVDGAHIYEETAEKRTANRTSAYRWINAAQRLGAQQIRIDTGGTPDMSDEMFQIIVEGYQDLMQHSKQAGLELIMENHWGANKTPENVVKILESVEGLGLLFDSNNWPEGRHEESWERCAKYANSVHIKTFEFDANGNETTVNIPKVVSLLREAGYQGVWGIESVPKDGDEYAAVEKTKVLLEKLLGNGHA